MNSETKTILSPDESQSDSSSLFWSQEESDIDDGCHADIGAGTAVAGSGEFGADRVAASGGLVADEAAVEESADDDSSDDSSDDETLASKLMRMRDAAGVDEPVAKRIRLFSDRIRAEKAKQREEAMIQRKTADMEKKLRECDDLFGKE
jgi:hypothetical protein